MPENGSVNGGAGRDSSSSSDRSDGNDNNSGGAREAKESFDRAMDNANRPDRTPATPSQTTTVSDDGDDDRNTTDKPDRAAGPPGIGAPPSSTSATDTTNDPDDVDEKEERGFIDSVIDTLSAPPTDAKGNARSTSPVSDRLNNTVSYDLDDLRNAFAPDVTPEQSQALADGAAVMEGYALGPSIPSTADMVLDGMFAGMPGQLSAAPVDRKAMEERGLVDQMSDAAAYGAGVVVGAGERAIDLVSDLPGAAWEGVSMVNDAAGTVLDTAVGWTGIDLFEGHAQRNAARGQAMVDGVMGVPGQIADGLETFDRNLETGNYYDAGRQTGSLALDVATIAVPASKVGALSRVDDVVPAGTGVARVETPRPTVHGPSADHIFGDRPGHLPDTPENRDLLETTASNRDNFLGSDEFGNDWYAETLDDGRQAWTSVRNGEVRNGGVNDTPRDFNEATGLSKPTRPGE